MSKITKKQPQKAGGKITSSKKDIDAKKLALEEKRLALEEKKLKLQSRTLSLIKELNNSTKQEPIKIGPPELMPGVVPKGTDPFIATDSFTQVAIDYANEWVQFYGTFPGYPKLALLTQSTDYRCVYETSAMQITREWGEIKSSNDTNDEVKEKIKKIEERMKTLKVRDLMRKHIENEFIFGRSQIYIEIKDQDQFADLPLTMTPKGVGKGSLIGFNLIEPVWSTPSDYNSTSPLRADFYVPNAWYVMGKKVHRDRLLTLITRPVPDLLKATYNFSGISMSQLMEPYVQRWQRTVDSISELIHSFSLTGLKTNMENILSDGDSGYELIQRGKLFSAIKDNQELMMIDKEGEEFFQFNTPLSSLDSLEQKAQEQMAAPSHIPLVFLLGITPSGLNASSKEEYKVFYDYISAWQNSYLLDHVMHIIKLIQLDMFGEIDDSLFFQFKPLEQMSEEQLAANSKAKAERDNILILGGVISQEESRERLSREVDGDFSGIAANDIPEDEELNNEDPPTLKEIVDET